MGVAAWCDKPNSLPTHHGNLYALDADTGSPIWRFDARTALLHSPVITSAPAADERRPAGRPAARQLVIVVTSGTDRHGVV